MSPASSGPLEVEKYIGACLISSRSKNPPQNGPPGSNRDMYYPRERYHQHQDIYSNQGCPLNIRPRRPNNEGWTGMPLISFANNHRRNRKENDTRSSSPRVVEDSSTLSRLAVHTQGVPLILSNRHNNRRNKNNPRTAIPSNRQVEPTKKDSNRAVDSISIASDESSGSNNSETCLPRIIKPRKRRKKDRKPHKSEPPPSGPSSLVTLKPYVVPFCYRDKVYTPPRYSEISENIVPLNSEDLSETPKLHHNFEDVVGLDVESESQPSVCQCRYCDPSGQIWDVDRHCYSPFLTTPTFSKTSPMIAEKIRSALEHLSTFSFEPEVLAEEKVVDRCLEISTEIVTSPNGHRDLEIRLFSAKGKKDKWDNDRMTNRMAPEE